MINKKISNLIKVAAIFVLLCGASARPQAADDSGVGVAIGFTLGAQALTKTREVCEAERAQSYECDQAALSGGPYLRVELAQRHSLMLAYRLTDKYEYTFTTSRGTYTDSFSSASSSIAYQYRLPLGSSDTEGFLKAGYHFTDFEFDTETVDLDGLLFGGGLVYKENFVLGYEFLNLDDSFRDGHAFYMGVEFGL